LRAESDENTCRKAFTPTEAESISAAREALLRPLARERQSHGETAPGRNAGAKLAQASEPKTRDAASVGVGYGRTTIAKVREVKAIAADESKPQPVREVAKQGPRMR
jgi:ParB family chromosome partitioning protein